MSRVLCVQVIENGSVSTITITTKRVPVPRINPLASFEERDVDPASSVSDLAAWCSDLAR